jgi:hypothetical protein
MSRRHHGRPHHPAHGAADQNRRVTGVSPTPAGTDRSGLANQGQGPVAAGSVESVRAERAASPPPTSSEPVGASSSLTPSGGTPTNGAPPPEPFRPSSAPRQDGAPPRAGGAGPHVPQGKGGPGPDQSSGPADRNGQCTAPQLRRFIKSRPYVPMHELRRRFGIDGGDDDVTPVRLDPGWVYVGLPSREGSLLGDLLRAGEIGYELSLDPRTPIVIGVYPMRPIPRS